MTRKMQRAALALLVLLALALPAAAQTVDAYRVEMVFTLPTPQGQVATKHRVVVGDVLTSTEANATAAIANKILFGLQRAYAQQPPPRGSAPFSAGVNVHFIEAPQTAISAAP